MIFQHISDDVMEVELEGHPELQLEAPNEINLEGHPTLELEGDPELELLELEGHPEVGAEAQPEDAEVKQGQKIVGPCCRRDGT